MSIHSILTQGQITVMPPPQLQPTPPPSVAATARRHHFRRQRTLGHFARTCRAPPGIAPARKPLARSSPPPRNSDIHTLTLFALSSANWKRPPAEVAGILRILHEYLLTETQHCIDEGIRLNIIGRRDRLSANLRQAIIDSEDATARGTRLHLAPRGRLLRPQRDLQRRAPLLQIDRAFRGIFRRRAG